MEILKCDVCGNESYLFVDEVSGSNECGECGSVIKVVNINDKDLAWVDTGNGSEKVGQNISNDQLKELSVL